MKDVPVGILEPSGFETVFHMDTAFEIHTQIRIVLENDAARFKPQVPAQSVSETPSLNP